MTGQDTKDSFPLKLNDFLSIMPSLYQRFMLFHFTTQNKVVGEGLKSA